MNNQPYMVRPTLIDLNPDENCCYPFIISINRCDKICNTVEDPLGKICIPNKIKEVNPNVFNTIKGINESKTLSKNISHLSIDVSFWVRNVTRHKNGTMKNVSADVKDQ